MYFYYTLASFGPRFEPYLKWKKYLTALQLIQFILIILHSIRVPFIGCEVSSAYFLLISTLLGGIFFYLFYSFYLENYCNYYNRNNISVFNEQNMNNSYDCRQTTPKLSTNNIKYQQIFS